jgi:hypothetical protein
MDGLFKLNDSRPTPSLKRQVLFLSISKELKVLWLRELTPHHGAWQLLS